MPILYNEKENRTEDSETGASLSSIMRHPSGHFEYFFTINNKTFSISAERHSLWDGPTDLSVPPSKRVVHINGFDQIVEWTNESSQTGKMKRADYSPYRSIIMSLLKVHHTSGDPESSIKVVIDFSNIDKFRKE